MTTTLGINALRILLDSDALIAMVEESDASHERAIEMFDALTARNALFFITSTTVAEVITTLQRKYSHRSAAGDLYERLLTHWVEIVPVDRDLIAGAHAYYTSSGSKQNTIFDAVNIAAVKAHHLDGIFSFDRWYGRQGASMVWNALK
ncbi:type II toxin-antitoxin system VapC family toxin [Candidatus Gottesmanbacteria bacterium]|nr:type II toxin-antitoxin system VapC family toxin [Candidatus Gottesmanbacteria bacterium]